MTLPPDFFVVGGRSDSSRAAVAAFTAVKLGQRAMLRSSADTVFLLAGAIEHVGSVGTTNRRIDASGMLHEALDARIVLAAQDDDEVDPTLPGKFTRSLVGVIARGFVESSVAATGSEAEPNPPIACDANVLFLSEDDFIGEHDAWSTARPAQNIALSMGPRGGIRLWWRGAWSAVAEDAGARRGSDSPAIAVLAAAFLVRLTETRDAVTASRFAAAATTLLPHTPSLSYKDIPDRDAIPQ